MANSKVSAFFSLLLVFISGAVVGVFGNRVYTTSVAPPAAKAFERRQPPSPEEFRRQLIDEMTREVHLDAGQVAQLSTIFDDTRQRFDEVNGKLHSESKAIRDDQISKIKSILRTDQVPLYEALRAKKEQEREARRRKNGPPAGVKKDQ